MSELQRLQKIREIGIRLQELQLIRIEGQASYAATALNFLFAQYGLVKPSGVPLQTILQKLADAVTLHHQLPYRRLSADSVLEFFRHRYHVVDTPVANRISSRRRGGAVAWQPSL